MDGNQDMGSIIEPRQSSNGKNEVDKAAAICYRPEGDAIEFLLVRAHGGGWIFPKGNIENGETPWQAAQREAFEEAGVTGKIQAERLTSFLHFAQENGNKGVEYQVAAFLMLVTGVQQPPETDRDPTWFSPQEAENAILQNRQPQYAQELQRVIDLAVRRAGKRGQGFRANLAKVLSLAKARIKPGFLFKRIVMKREGRRG